MGGFFFNTTFDVRWYFMFSEVLIKSLKEVIGKP